MTQATAFDSPWSVAERVRTALWAVCSALFFRPTPKPLNPWRVALLRLFGAKVSGRPFVASSARIKFPWRLELRNRACIGPDADIYNLGGAVLRERATVAQQVMLCGGTHDFSTPRLPLIVGRIEIGADAFIGARAIVLPGRSIGPLALVGAGSVVTRDIPAGEVWAGNPARFLSKRSFSQGATIP
jgi:putative colanic acid biosynthesis acetyltransferase WcaF